MPQVKETRYNLEAEIFDAADLPEQLDSCSIHITIGPYHVESQVNTVTNSYCRFNEKLPVISERFPFEEAQIPDIVVYISKNDRKSNRISFLRIPASELIGSSTDANWPIKEYKLEEDKAKDALNDEEFPGYVTMRLKLFKDQPPKGENIFADANATLVKNYVLRIFLYQARDLPPADETATSDPFVKFRSIG